MIRLPAFWSATGRATRAATRAADQETLDTCARAVIAERREPLFDQTVAGRGFTPDRDPDLSIEGVLADLEMCALPMILGDLHDHARWAA